MGREEPMLCLKWSMPLCAVASRNRISALKSFDILSLLTSLMLWGPVYALRYVLSLWPCFYTHSHDTVGISLVKLRILQFDFYQRIHNLFFDSLGALYFSIHSFCKTGSVISMRKLNIFPTVCLVSTTNFQSIFHRTFEMIQGFMCISCCSGTCATAIDT